MLLGMIRSYYIDLTCSVHLHSQIIRGVAQLVSVPALGPGGRRSSLRHPDFARRSFSEGGLRPEIFVISGLRRARPDFSAVALAKAGFARKYLY